MINQSGIYPSGDRILVKPDIIEETTEGGIYIPDTVRESHMDAQMSGTLVAVGKDAYKGATAPYAEVGDKVCFAKFGGQRLWGKDGEQYRLLYDDDINAVIDTGVRFTEVQSRRPFSKKD